MPMTPEEKREYQKNYMREKRSNKKPVRPGKNVRPKVLDPVRPVLDENTEYPPIVYMLADIKKRAKLRSICGAFSGKRTNLMDEVRVGINGPTLDVVAELLTAFE